MVIKSQSIIEGVSDHTSHRDRMKSKCAPAVLVVIAFVVSSTQSNQICIKERGRKNVQKKPVRLYRVINVWK